MDNGFEGNGLVLLESLDLGSPKRYKKEEDNFENEMNNLLAKLNNQLENTKNKAKINFEFKPFNLDLDSNSNINLNKESNNININNNNININNIIDNSDININHNNMINENNINNNINNNNNNNNIIINGGNNGDNNIKILKNESTFNLIDSNIIVNSLNDVNNNINDNNDKRMNNESNFNGFQNMNNINENNNDNNIIDDNSKNINNNHYNNKIDKENNINKNINNVNKFESNKESLKEIDIIDSINNNEEQILRNGNNNNDEEILRNGNNNNNNKQKLQTSNNSNNDQNNLINNNELNNNYTSMSPLENNENKIDRPKNINNSSNNSIMELDNNQNKELKDNNDDNNNNNSKPEINNSQKKEINENNNNIKDSFEIDEIIEIQCDLDKNNNSNVQLANNENKNNDKEIIKDNNLLNTNINPNPSNENYKLNIEEIEFRESDLNNDNISEKKKENNEKKEDNEEKEERDEKQEKSENKKEIDDERSKSNGKEEEKENLEKNEKMSLEVDKQSEKNLKRSNSKKESENENEKKEEQKSNESYNDNDISDKEDKKQPKEEKKQDEMDLDIGETKSYETVNNLGAPETPNISIAFIRESENIKNLKKSKDEEKLKSKNSINIKNSTNIKNSKIENNSNLKQNKSMPEKKKNQLKNSSYGGVKKSKTTNSLIRTTIAKIENVEESLEISNINDYPILTDFSYEEKALSELIPNYKEKILNKEKREEIEAREYFLNKNKSLKDNTKEGERFSQYMGESDLSHYDIMKKEFEDKGFENMPEYDSNFEENIFGEEMLEILDSPIGEVEDVNSFLQKYFLAKNKKIIDASNKFFVKWRKILGDGDSFYRILMFSLFEAYILSNNIGELNILIREIASNEFVELYKEKEIDYNKCFSIFSIILNLLENKESSKAYEILLKSYLLKDYSFDKLLIVYIKHVIVIYIEKLIEICNQNGRNISNSALNTYKIESLNIEPSFLVICIIPYLFNINMNVLTIKGNTLEPAQSQINFVDPEEQDIPLISFGYFYSSYYKLYQPNFEEIYKYDIKLTENNNKELTYILKESQKCTKCDKPTEQIVFLEKKFKICKICLENKLSDICNFRADSFKEDGFIGLEYYTRPIHFNENYYIDDLEIFELLEFNLINILCQKYTSLICAQCKQKKERNELIEFNCGCLFCQNCIENMIINMTNGLKYLNPKEKDEFNDEKCPGCKKEFDIEMALEHANYDNEDVKEAAHRLKEYINMLCLVCKIVLRKEDNISNKYIDQDVKYRKIKIKKSNKNERANGIDYMEIEHLICENCFLKYFKNNKIIISEEDEENENQQIKIVDSEKGTIFCKLCFREHYLDPKFVEEGGCCSGCSIF